MEKDQLIEYYQKELTYIRNLAGEFAELHDDIAGKLKLNKNECNDPHTERIIEAFAFLSARIHKKIDDHFPEIIESLFDIIYPEYNRQVPSMAIVQMNPGESINKIETSGYPIERHTPLYSQTQDNDPVCRFQTCYPVRMYPIKIEKITHEKIAGKEFISIEIVAKNSKPFLSAIDMDELRFFISGASHYVFQLYEALFHYQKIHCEIITKTGETVDIQGKFSLNPIGFNDNESLIPEKYSNRSFPGYRLLYELFLYPEKFLFFDIKGFRHLKKQSDLYDRMNIRIQLKRPLSKIIQITDETFRLNATPIINLFEKNDIRLKLNPYQTEFHVISDNKNRMTTEIFSIDKVLTSEPSPRKKQVEYAPYYSTDHTIYSGYPKKTVYFQAKRKKSSQIGDNGTEIYLSFRNHQDKIDLPEQDLLMLNVTCTNRDAPMYLNFNPASEKDFRIEEKYAHVKCIQHIYHF
ncbi:type VI secretion system protein ImpG [Candidatus Magnetomorum sp. HK-1]|nr:type VI secretion system protein ImpG [Candidatus Magnetomorum sp. HK-1]